MKYKLDKQFRAVSHLHLPLQKWMAAPSQVMLRALPCRSDENTEVQRMMVVGPDSHADHPPARRLRRAAVPV